jgi:fumarate reductase subunit D
MESNLIMDDQFKLSGWAMTLYGLATFSAFIYVLFLTITQLSLFESFSFVVNVLLLIMFLINVLPLFCGFHLLKHNKNIHKLALPTSVIIMLAFPVGTVVGGLYLWQRYKNTKQE